ncbi:MAG: phosphoglycerate kinase [Alphaproteobacteria bacterium]|jgi:phosphoglycerate kinase|nr:phosphoglycerate kinase [Alphaproteobacteria bacterium]
MSTYKTIDDFDPKGKRVLLRVDLNVPMRDGKVTDATRIERAAPTITELAKRGARVIVMSHFGRPKGQREPSMSLAPLAGPLSQTLGGTPVQFADDCIGDAAMAVVSGLGDGDVALLENLRYHAAEEANDDAFAAALAALGDTYVNDAFAAAHRAHASIEAVARKLPAHAGRLMQAELEALGAALENPKRPVAAIVGGAKVSTKLELLGNLVSRVDRLIIGGGMANTFLYARGLDVGASLAERDLADTAREIETRAEAAGCEILLQDDAVVAGSLEAGVATKIVPVDQVPSDMMILDAGPASAARFGEAIAACRTVVWNGPLGAFEIPPFDAATTGLARRVADLTDAGEVLSVAGGGDTVAALAQAGVQERFSYVSTAGGAFLEWMEGKELPGVAVLKTEK